jgi:hypothetical protein
MRSRPLRRCLRLSVPCAYNVVMNIKSSTGYQRSEKRVVVGEITKADTQEAILDKAMVASGVRFSNLFDWKVGEIRNGECLVRLYTD